MKEKDELRNTIHDSFFPREEAKEAEMKVDRFAECRGAKAAERRSSGRNRQRVGRVIPNAPKPLSVFKDWMNGTAR
jgi:hypothetical protein